jgi:hypothetical protein
MVVGRRPPRTAKCAMRVVQQVAHRVQQEGDRLERGSTCVGDGAAGGCHTEGPLLSDHETRHSVQSCAVAALCRHRQRLMLACDNM